MRLLSTFGDIQSTISSNSQNAEPSLVSEQGVVLGVANRDIFVAKPVSRLFASSTFSRGGNGRAKPSAALEPKPFFPCETMRAGSPVAKFDRNLVSTVPEVAGLSPLVWTEMSPGVLSENPGVTVTIFPDAPSALHTMELCVKAAVTRYRKRFPHPSMRDVPIEAKGR